MNTTRVTPRRASVLVIVMVTLLFATFALVAFMEKASVDLLVDQREALDRRLRMEAYSALEVSLGVLALFREVGQGLRSPSEGWSNPLEFAGYEPTEGRKVEIGFEDESGKISLPHANAMVLTNLFKHWGLQQADSEQLADALLGWIKRGHTYTSAVAPNYDSGQVPYEEPGRSMKSYHELAAIAKAREVFYDEDGRPNELWKRFTEAVSLFDFPRPNLNSAKADVLAALGQFDQTGQQNVADFLNGAGQFTSQGPSFFQNPNDAQRIAGPTGDVGGFGTTISALRVFIVVRDGSTDFRLATVIAPPGGAKAVEASATSTRAQASATAAENAAQQKQNRPNAMPTAPRSGPTAPGAQQNAAARNLRYPFALLEIRENDEISQTGVVAQ